MTRWEQWSFNALNLLVAASGFLYFWMKYLLRTEDPFAVVNHPWQAGILAAHVLAAPLLIAVFGAVFRSHVLGKVLANDRRGRLSGWSSLAGFALMAVSGYLIQVVTEPRWLRFMEVAHVAAGGFFVLGYAAHLARRYQLVRVARNGQRARPEA